MGLLDDASLFAQAKLFVEPQESVSGVYRHAAKPASQTQEAPTSKGDGAASVASKTQPYLVDGLYA